MSTISAEARGWLLVVPILVLIHDMCIDDSDLEVINAGQGVEDHIISPYASSE